ncbi:MAG: glycosyltransferase family 39 protein [Pyrinomonadaceae bacterium]|nr:glycosyltransferase family 39 protein [Pyrinomonadaceae bacterium]
MNPVSNNIKKIWQAACLPKFLFVFIVVWTAVVMFGTISFGDLSGYDDAAYTHEAKTMVQSGDWWTMSLNGNPDFDKPPLFIWLLAISFKIFGATDFAAKVPGVLLGWATVVLVYFLAKEMLSNEPENSSAGEDAASRGEWLPILSMLSLATTQYFLKYSSHAMTDVPFTFFFTLSVYFYVRSLKNDYFLLLSGIATGLAMLTRSPMGLFPLAIIASHLVFTRRLKLLFSFNFAGCVVFALLIPATWFLREYNLFGDVFVNRHFGNFLAHSEGAANPRTGWQQFLWYFEYLFLIVKLYFPWFPLMFYGLFLAVRKARQSRFSAPVETLLIIWFFVVLVPFSLAESKVLRYILPVFPALSILSAYGLYSLLSIKRLPKFAQITVLLLTLAAFIAVAFPNYELRAGDMRMLAPISDAATAPGEKVVLYTSGELQANFQTQLLWYGNRLCTHLKDLREVEALLADRKQAVVIMDKSSFAQFTSQNKLKITILGESEKFVCFRRASDD